MSYIYVILMVVIALWLLKKGARLAGTIFKLGLLAALGYLVYLSIQNGW